MLLVDAGILPVLSALPRFLLYEAVFCVYIVLDSRATA